MWLKVTLSLVHFSSLIDQPNSELMHESSFKCILDVPRGYKVIQSKPFSHIHSLEANAQKKILEVSCSIILQRWADFNSLCFNNSSKLWKATVSLLLKNCHSLGNRYDEFFKERSSIWKKIEIPTKVARPIWIFYESRAYLR